MRAQGRRHGRRRLAAGVLVCLAACTPGAYPNDLFGEMHYQPSQRRLEPDRLAPPPDAVPVTGGRPAYTYEQAAALQNPIVRDPEAARRAAQIYSVNCAVCHGANGDGKGPMAGYFERAGAIPPADLASAPVRARTDGQLYWLVSYGLGNMPAFDQLLSERDTWTVVLLIRDLQERRGP